MTLLNQIAIKLECDQKELSKVNSISAMNKMNKIDKTTESLATISEITKQCLMSLDLLKKYQLVNITGNSQSSLINCLNYLSPNTLIAGPQMPGPRMTEIAIALSWAQATEINLVIWTRKPEDSGIKNPRNAVVSQGLTLPALFPCLIQLIPATNPAEIDRPTMMLYLNKYGQYFPIKAKQCHSLLYYPGTENPQRNSSFLLLKLLENCTQISEKNQ